MNWFFVLSIICYKLSDNRILASMKPTDEPLATPLMSDPTENSFFDNIQERNTENETSISTVPENSDISGICPHSSCLDNVTDYRNSTPPSRGCYCDKLCIGLRDCCEDFPFYDEEEQRKPRTLDCDFLLYDGPYGYYADRGCSRSWTDLEIKKKCVKSRNLNLNTADLDLVVPVTSLSTGVTYGNMFCAICSNDDDFMVWNIRIHDCINAEEKLECTEIVVDENDSFGAKKYEVCNKTMKSINSSDLKFNGKQWYVMGSSTKHVCELKLSAPEETKPNSCVLNEAFKSLVINSCRENWTDPTVLSQCQGAYALVYHNISGEHPKIYKNKFCAYCNGLNDSQLFCKPPSFKVDNKTIPISYSYVKFDFNMDLSSTAFCRKALIKGKHMTSSEKRFCPIYAEKTSNWFFTLCTSIALLVSLILLICHLLVFTVVKKLHTIEGKNLASFCLALILAYCNFLASNYLKGYACFIVSIVTYYSFLSSFSWMFTISFDIWSTFRDRKKKVKSPRDLKLTFSLYSIWSWTMPGFFVSSAVYFDLCRHHPDLAPHFRENKCWFPEGYSLMLFFVGPVSVIILINFILFLHVALILCSNQCASTNQKAYVDFKLYALIVLLTSFTWITGFIAVYFQNIVIWYISIILNTGQGFLIFLGFTCKKEFISITLEKIGSSCLTASCKKLLYPTVTTNVNAENETVTEVKKNCEFKLIEKELDRNS